MIEQIAPGLWHWSAKHEHTHGQAHSYYLEREGVLIDPMIPARRGSSGSSEHGAPQHVLMTNRHHDRDAWRLARRLRLRQSIACAAACTSSQVAAPVEPFDFGDELPGGVDCL